MQRIFVDTYVKTYLRDGERWLQKRKTRVVRHTNEPDFRQTLRYSACDVLGRTLGNQTLLFYSYTFELNKRTCFNFHTYFNRFSTNRFDIEIYRRGKF